MLSTARSRLAVAGLVVVSVLACAIVFSGSAGATTFTPQASASVVQDGNPGDADGDGVPDASDKCPNQAGSEDGDGCVDSDGDGVDDDQDKCPNQQGYDPSTEKPTADGCPLPPVPPSIRVSYFANGPFPGKAQFGSVYFECQNGTDSCKTQGVVSLTVSAAIKRKLRLPSTLLAKGDMSHPCGEGVTCVNLTPKPSVRKKVQAWYKKETDDGRYDDSKSPLPVEFTFAATFPVHKTLSTTIAVSSNKRLTFEFGGNFPPGGKRTVR